MSRKSEISRQITDIDYITETNTYSAFLPGKHVQYVFVSLTSTSMSSQDIHFSSNPSNVLLKQLVYNLFFLR